MDGQAGHVDSLKSGSPGLSTGGTWTLRALYPGDGRSSRVETVVPKARREAGPERWARWAAMVDGGLTRAEVARREGVSRAAVTIGLSKLSALAAQATTD